MLKKLVNEARFALTLTTTGPLLIKSGMPTQIGPDMTPVLTMRHGEPEVFIPGSSLKGVFRSHTEKVIRTIRDGEIVVADPFERQGENQSCGYWFEERNKERKKRKEEPLPNTVIYAESCPVHRLFGSTYFIGRVSIGDAYLIDEKGNYLGYNEEGEYLGQNVPKTKRLPTEPRDGVGIDRLTGGSSHGALFNLEAVSTGTRFRAEVLLRNFECWQLGALLLVVQDMEDELIRLGSGKSRGLGSVKGAVDKITIHHIGRVSGKPTTDIWGLGHFLGNDISYGTQPDDTLTISNAPTAETNGVRTMQTFTGDSLQELKQQSVQEFVRRMETYPVYKSQQWGA